MVLAHGHRSATAGALTMETERSGVHLGISVRRLGEDVVPNQPHEGDARMSNLLFTPIAVVAGRELALSARPDAPVVAGDARAAARRLRRGS
jgi:hypothetical protein